MSLLTRKLKEEAKIAKLLLLNNSSRTPDDITEFIRFKKCITNKIRFNKKIVFVSSRFLTVK